MSPSLIRRQLRRHRPRGGRSPAVRTTSAPARSRCRNVTRGDLADRDPATTRARRSGDHLQIPTRDRQHRDHPGRPSTARTDDLRQSAAPARALTAPMAAMRARGQPRPPRPHTTPRSGRSRGHRSISRHRSPAQRCRTGESACPPGACLAPALGRRNDIANYSSSRIGIVRIVKLGRSHSAEGVVRSGRARPGSARSRGCACASEVLCRNGGRSLR